MPFSTSVIIPAYNQGHYLGQAIQSVLEQTRQDFEIIVVDDGSTDSTRAVAESYADPRVRYIYQANRGLSAARNTGIHHATGAFLSFLDSDDQFLPRKLELLLDALGRDPELGLAAGKAIPIDHHGNMVGRIFDRPLPVDTSRLVLGNPLHVGSVLLRRSWQERVGFFDESMRSYEDWDMWLRLALAGCSMAWVAEPVSLYRFHQAQMTRNGRQMTAASFAVLDKLYADPALPASWRNLRDQAYSNAHLRRAAQAYLTDDFQDGQQSLLRAVHLNPELMAHHGELLARRFAAWTDLPKTDNALAFLERVYSHLPEELADLRKRARAHLGRAAMQQAFQAYEHKDMGRARASALRALRYQPAQLANRGTLALLAKSMADRPNRLDPKV